MGAAIKALLKKILPPTTSMVDARVGEVSDRVAGELNQSRFEIERLSRELSCVYADLFKNELQMSVREICDLNSGGQGKVVVSIATYGPRAPLIAPMLWSLQAQTYASDAILLWIPRADFPRGCSDLPVEVLHAVRSANARIVWVDNDLGPHNKYFHVMKALPSATVITLDDDVVYPNNHLATLLDCSREHPGCIVAARTHMITFRDDGSFAPYESWVQEQSVAVDRPDHRLIPTGVGGVLYPPQSLDMLAFDDEAIRKTCYKADDLWLKIMSALRGVPVVDPGCGFDLDYCPSTQESALWLKNKEQGDNDKQLSAIMEHVACVSDAGMLMKWIADGDSE